MISLPPLPDLPVPTMTDLPKPSGFSSAEVKLGEVAGRVKPAAFGNLRIEADLGKLDAGIQRIREQQKTEQFQRLIEKAQGLINRKQFRRALEVLEQAESVDPTAATVPLLKGHCLAALEDYEAALKELTRARKLATDRELIVLILMLEAVCTRSLTEAVEARLRELIEKERFEQALDLMELELRNWPLNVAFHYHRCALLLKLERLLDAERAIREGMRVAGSENVELFQELLDWIRIQENQRYLESARQALRRGDPAGALRHLDTCATALAGHEQYEAIRAYAQEKSPKGLLGGLFSRKTAEPLTGQTRQNLLVWLVAEEMAAGIAAMSLNKFGEAARAFSAAEKIDGGCAIICYLHGLAIFREFHQLVGKKERPPDPRSILGSLTTASGLLSRAMGDPVVGQQGAELREVVDDYVDQLNDALATRARLEEEARPVNELVKDFNDLMENLQKEPLRSAQDVERAQERFRALRQRAERVGRGRSQDRGGETVEQVKEAIDRNLRQLEELRAEAQKTGAVNDCVAAFNTMMTYFKDHPISNRKELELARAMAKGLRTMVTSARRNLPSNSPGHDVLNQLDGALGNIDRQLNT